VSIRLIMMLFVLLVTCYFANGESRLAESTQGPMSSVRFDEDQTIKLEVVINAPAEKVWWAWTTRDGIRSFFAPDCDVDLRVLGKYDILFAPSAPSGLRGAEGNLILAIQEGKMLSFTWDAPPVFPEIRKQRTSVTVRIVPMDKDKVKVVLTHAGWGEGEEWKKVHDYFLGAWGDIVLPNLKRSLEVGPIDWKKETQNTKSP
jgi:uncharacterized protein YndB with AHSA1/START domain